MDRIERPNNRRPAEQWEAAKDMYAKGETLQEISQKLGIPLGSLKVKAWRHKWDGMRVRTLTAVVTETKAFQRQGNEGLEERGRKIRTTLSKAIERQAGRLADQPTECLRDELDLASAIGKAAAAASLIHGWDRESISTSVRIGAMGEVDAEEGARAIDAQSM